jgi:hypothetical protein
MMAGRPVVIDALAIVRDIAQVVQVKLRKALVLKPKIPLFAISRSSPSLGL